MSEIRYEVRARFNAVNGDDIEITEVWAMQEGDEDHQYVSAFLNGTVSMSDIAQTVTDGTDLDPGAVSEVEVVRVHGPIR